MTAEESILVVDDDSGFLEVVKIILKKRGYYADTAASASEAIAKANERLYNIAILDISLPDIGGTELLSMLISINPDIMAIILTGYSSIQNATQALNRGAFAYLEKPLNPDHLLSVITRGLEKQRLVMENRRLMTELEQRHRETNILLSVSHAVSQSLELAQIIDSALEELAQTMNLEFSHVHLFDSGRLCLNGYYGWNPEIVSEMQQVEIDDTIANRVFKQAIPIIIDDLSTTVPETSLSPLAKDGYISYVGVPLTTAGKTIGILGAATRSPRRFLSREVELLIGIGREISIAVRNAQLYEEASSAKAQKKLDALRTELLANVSHELRTPLAAIKGFASTLLQPDVSFDAETLHDFLQTIDKEADRLNYLIEELLVMSRLEAGALEIKRERHNIAEVIESVKDSLYTLAPRHKLRISVPGNLPSVTVDAFRIGEVLTNLVHNAAKCSREGTQITVEAHRNGNGSIIVSVADEGVGIPAECQQDIFKRFYQVNDPEQGHRPGTGLGLCICAGIVETHGGKIWVDSEPGKGSKFSFSIATN